jgi:hypothetical protein
MKTARSGAGRRLGTTSGGGIDDGRRDSPSLPDETGSVGRGDPPISLAESAGPLELAQEEQLVDLTERPMRAVERDPAHECGQVGGLVR